MIPVSWKLRQTLLEFRRSDCDFCCELVTNKSTWLSLSDSWLYRGLDLCICECREESEALFPSPPANTLKAAKKSAGNNLSDLTAIRMQFLRPHSALLRLIKPTERGRIPSGSKRCWNFSSCTYSPGGFHAARKCVRWWEITPENIFTAHLLLVPQERRQKSIYLCCTV